MKTWISHAEFRKSNPCPDGYRWILKHYRDGFYLDDLIEYLKEKNQAWAAFLSTSFKGKQLFPDGSMIFDCGNPDENTPKPEHYYQVGHGLKVTEV